MRQNLNIKIKVEFSPIVHLRQRMKTLRKTETELQQKNKDDFKRVHHNLVSSSNRSKYPGWRTTSHLESQYLSSFSSVFGSRGENERKNHTCHRKYFTSLMLHPKK